MNIIAGLVAMAALFGKKDGKDAFFYTPAQPAAP
jgi:hypothetical protein